MSRMLPIGKVSLLVLLVLILVIALSVGLIAKGASEPQNSEARNSESQARNVSPASGTGDGPMEDIPVSKIPDTAQTAVFGGGCFWCTEAVFEKIEGVYRVESGYAGGDKVNPTYEEVSSGRTGHAEVIKIWYDPDLVTYRELLDLFFRAHDPTTLNRQGYDVGTQYRSIILVETEAERLVAEQARAAATAYWTNPIVTQIELLDTYYEAEDFHQDFFRNNPSYGYCTAIIRPKLNSLGLSGVDEISVEALDLSGK